MAMSVYLSQATFKFKEPL